MIDAITALWAFLATNAEDRYEQLRNWAPVAFRALTDLLLRILRFSLFALAVSLVISGIAGGQGWFDGRIILPWLGIAYACAIAAMLYTWQAMQAAGLLLGIDAAVDIFKSVTPINKDKLKKLGTLDLDFARLKELATLQLVGKFVFNVLLFELLVIFTFSFIPIWTQPKLAGPLVLGGLIYGLLSTPWGQTSPFGRLAKPVGIICLLIVVIFARDELMSLLHQVHSFLPAAAPSWYIGLAILMAGIFLTSLPNWLRRPMMLIGSLMLLWGLMAPKPVQPRQVRAQGQGRAASELLPSPPPLPPDWQGAELVERVNLGKLYFLHKLEKDYSYVLLAAGSPYEAQVAGSTYRVDDAVWGLGFFEDQFLSLRSDGVTALEICRLKKP